MSCVFTSVRFMTPVSYDILINRLGKRGPKAASID